MSFRLPASFGTVTDLLREAQRGRLEQRGPLTLFDADGMAPWVDFALGRLQHQHEFSNIRTESAIGSAVAAAIGQGHVFGSSAGEMTGVLPVVHAGVPIAPERFIQWSMRFRNAAVDGGCTPTYANALTGVLGELVDNVGEHGGSPSSAVAAFRASEGSVEFVVADNGVGALGSLRQNPKYSTLPDAAAALNAIVFEGATRDPDEHQHGHGVRQLFRTLVGRYGNLRFRSGDHALALGSEGILERGKLESRAEAPLPGFSISVLCRFARTIS